MPLTSPKVSHHANLGVAHTSSLAQFHLFAPCLNSAKNFSVQHNNIEFNFEFRHNWVHFREEIFKGFMLFELQLIPLICHCHQYFCCICLNVFIDYVPYFRNWLRWFIDINNTLLRVGIHRTCIHKNSIQMNFVFTKQQLVLNVNSLGQYTQFFIVIFFNIDADIVVRLIFI